MHATQLQTQILLIVLSGVLQWVWIHCFSNVVFHKAEVSLQPAIPERPLLQMADFKWVLSHIQGVRGQPGTSALRKWERGTMGHPGEVSSRGGSHEDSVSVNEWMCLVIQLVSRNGKLSRQGYRGRKMHGKGNRERWGGKEGSRSKQSMRPLKKGGRFTRLPLGSGYILQLSWGHPGLCSKVTFTYTRSSLKVQFYMYAFSSVWLTYETFIEPHSVPSIFHPFIY